MSTTASKFISAAQVRGLSLQQQECLRLLSKQVVAQMELRISNASLTSALAARDALQAKNAESEAAIHALKSAFVAVVSHEARDRPFSIASAERSCVASSPPAALCLSASSL